LDIGSGVGVVGFETAGLFNPGIYATVFLPIPLVQATENVLGLFDRGNQLPQGEHSLLEVLPPGLSANQIQFGYTPIGLASVQGSVVVVPEPAAVMLSAVGAAWVVAQRRRRR
jgi:hypothetical protein